jgi:hypothetical protein
VLLHHSFFKEAYVQLVAKLNVAFSEKPLQEVYSGSCFAERALALFLLPIKVLNIIVVENLNKNSKSNHYSGHIPCLKYIENEPKQYGDYRDPKSGAAGAVSP